MQQLGRNQTRPGATREILVFFLPAILISYRCSFFFLLPAPGRPVVPVYPPVSIPRDSGKSQLLHTKPENLTFIFGALHFVRALSSSRPVFVFFSPFFSFFFFFNFSLFSLFPFFFPPQSQGTSLVPPSTRLRTSSPSRKDQRPVQFKSDPLFSTERAVDFSVLSLLPTSWLSCVSACLLFFFAMGMCRMEPRNLMPLTTFVFLFCPCHTYKTYKTASPVNFPFPCHTYEKEGGGVGQNYRYKPTTALINHWRAIN